MTDSETRDLEHRALEGDHDALALLKTAWLRLGAAGLSPDGSEERKRVILSEVHAGVATHRQVGTNFEVAYDSMEVQHATGPSDATYYVYDKKQLIPSVPVPAPGTRIVAWVVLLVDGPYESGAAGSAPHLHRLARPDEAIIVGRPSEVGQTYEAKVRLVARPSPDHGVVWEFEDCPCGHGREPQLRALGPPSPGAWLASPDVQGGGGSEA